MRVVPGALESDFERFYHCGLHEVGAGRRVHWFRAARWVCNLPAEAVTPVALDVKMRRSGEESEQQQAKRDLDRASALLAKRHEGR